MLRLAVRLSAQRRRISPDAEEEMLLIDQVRYRYKAKTRMRNFRCTSSQVLNTPTTEYQALHERLISSERKLENDYLLPCRCLLKESLCFPIKIAHLILNSKSVLSS